MSIIGVSMQGVSVGAFGRVTLAAPVGLSVAIDRTNKITTNDFDSAALTAEALRRTLPETDPATLSQRSALKQSLTTYAKIRTDLNQASVRPPDREIAYRKFLRSLAEILHAIPDNGSFSEPAQRVVSSGLIVFGHDPDTEAQFNRLTEVPSEFLSGWQRLGVLWSMKRGDNIGAAQKAQRLGDQNDLAFHLASVQEGNAQFFAEQSKDWYRLEAKALERSAALFSTIENESHRNQAVELYNKAIEIYERLKSDDDLKCARELRAKVRRLETLEEALRTTGPYSIGMNC